MLKSFLVAFAALAVVFSAASSEAQFKGAGKYAAGIVEFQANASDFSFDKEKSKVQIKPSKKALEGGWSIQLNAKFIDCPAVGNDKGAAGKCGENGAPVTNHVMELNIHVLGVLATKVGILYEVEKGKARFSETQKNKTFASAAGPLVSVLFATSIGVDGIRLRTTGTDVLNPTTGCAVQPLPPVNTCTDGMIYGIAGFRAGEDPETTCLNTAQCDGGGAQPTLICTGGLCETESCVSDADCDQNGGGSGGSGQCDCDNNQCCTDALLPGCSANC